MSKKDIIHEKGKAVAGTLHDAADTLKESAKKVKLPEIKKPELKSPEEVKEIIKNKLHKEDGETKSERAETDSISTRDAIKIFYYLMAADGQIFQNEEEKFDAIGTELDPHFAEHKTEIVEECKAHMDKIIDTEDYYDVLQDGVENAIASSKPTEDTFITPKLLVWNMLTVAYSDGKYDEVERRLIKYVVRKLDVDKAVLLEMESSILTLMDLEKELTWIKTTDRPYLTIEAVVNEIADRKNVISDSVKSLIAL